MSEKSEAPSEKALRDAREEGQVAVSRDLAHLLSLSLLGELAFLGEAPCREALQALFGLAIERIHAPFEAARTELLTQAMMLMLPLFGASLLAVLVAAVAGNWGQFGVLIAPGVLTPDINKLNPANGVKNLFSMKKVVEVGIALLKVTLIALVTWCLIRDALPVLVTFAGGTPAGIHGQFLILVRVMFRTLCGICLVLALIDFAVQRHFLIKQLMMSKDDLKREHKDAEGDPMVKGQRRQLARDLASAPAVDSTAEADVLVVNPTHFAIAMRYDVARAQVPVLLAKGRDEVAQAMIRRAHELGIPVIRHVWLARTLYAAGAPARPVPRASYAAVAHVYAVVEQLDGRHGASEVVLEASGLAPETHGQ